jgi:hypothetical protein
MQISATPYHEPWNTDMRSFIALSQSFSSPAHRLPLLPKIPAVSESATAQSTLDRVMSQDGSVISNRVLGMVAGELHIKTAWEVGDDTFVSNLGQMVVNRSVPFHLKGGASSSDTSRTLSKEP